MIFVAIGWLVPKFYDPFVPVEKRGEGHLEFAPNEAVAVVEAYQSRMGGASGYSPDEQIGFERKEMA